MSYTLFFDTETTGLPKNRYISATGHANNWPDIVSIAWILYEDGALMNKQHHIICPEGWDIPQESVKFHGINTEKAVREGKPLKDIMELFLEDARKANQIIAHNFEFDKNVIINALYWRLNDTSMKYWNSSVEFCSCEESKDELKLPGRYGYKFPSLDELYFDTFKKTRDSGAHNADRDVEDLAMICWERWDILDVKGNPIVLKSTS